LGIMYVGGRGCFSAVAPRANGCQGASPVPDLPQDDSACKRTVASLTRLERKWLKVRHCSFCEAPMLGSYCYAYSGEHVLPIIEGVRDAEETINLGPPCNMDERRAHALTHYRPRGTVGV